MSEDGRHGYEWEGRAHQGKQCYPHHGSVTTTFVAPVSYNQLTLPTTYAA